MVIFAATAAALLACAGAPAGGGAPPLRVHSDMATAVAPGKPVVALESTITGGACPAPVRSHKDFLVALNATGNAHDIAGGWIVNLGAALVHPGNRYSNTDLSWELFFRERQLRLRMVAFEGSPSAIANNEQEYARKGGQFELDEDRAARLIKVHEYVRAETLASELHKRGVPRSFLLLKVDIDSFDLQAADAVLAAYHPLLIYVEVGSGLPPFVSAGALSFAALSPAAGAPAARYGEGVNRYNRFSVVGCAGATFRSWETWAQSRGYAIHATDPFRKNALLVRVRPTHHIPSGRSCHSPGFGGMFGRALNISEGVTPEDNPRGWSRVLAMLDAACNRTNTPYMVRLDGQCCPKRLGASLSLCRCSYQSFAGVASETESTSL